MGPYVSLVSVLAWPVTVLFIAFLFREELRRALRRLELVKYGEFEADFNKELLKAEAEAATAKTEARQARPPAGGVIPESTRGYAAEEDFDLLYRQAILAPAEAVLAAWHKLERVIVEAERTVALDSSEPARIMPGLVAECSLTPALASQVERLRAIVASVSAAPEARQALGPDQARRFLDLARGTITQIRSAAQSRLSGGSVA